MTTSPGEMRTHSMDFYTDLFGAEQCHMECREELLEGLPQLIPGEKAALDSGGVDSRCQSDGIRTGGTPDFCAAVTASTLINENISSGRAEDSLVHKTLPWREKHTLPEPYQIVYTAGVQPTHPLANAEQRHCAQMHHSRTLSLPKNRNHCHILRYVKDVIKI